MKSKIALSIIIITALSCQQKPKESSALPVTGTWELVSETKITNTDTTFAASNKDQQMIKMLNDTHFSFLKHDLNKGKDTAAATFVAGGGRYTLKGNEYTEQLDYCNAREWEGNSFTFNITIQNDTLIQSGREKVEGTDIDRIIIEKYVRVK